MVRKWLLYKVTKVWFLLGRIIRGNIMITIIIVARTSTVMIG